MRAISQVCSSTLTLEHLVRLAQRVVRGHELLPGGDGEELRHEPGEQHRRRDRRDRGDRLDDAGEPVGRRPQRPDFHGVGGAAGDDEHPEAEDHPVEGDVRSLAGQVDEREGDGRVRERRQRVGADVQRHQAGVPEVTMPVRHEAVGGEQAVEEGGQDGGEVHRTRGYRIGRVPIGCTRGPVRWSDPKRDSACTQPSHVLGPRVVAGTLIRCSSSASAPRTPPSPRGSSRTPARPRRRCAPRPRVSASPRRASPCW